MSFEGFFYLQVAVSAERSSSFSSVRLGIEGLLVQDSTVTVLVSWSKILDPLLSTGSTQDITPTPNRTEKLLTGMFVFCQSLCCSARREGFSWRWFF